MGRGEVPGCLDAWYGAAMVKSLEIALEKVRKLPAARQEAAASILEDFLAAAEPAAKSPLAERKLGFMEGEFEITGDIVNTSDLWPPDSTVKNWNRLMTQLGYQDELIPRPSKRQLKAKKAGNSNS